MEMLLTSFMKSPSDLEAASCGGALDHSSLKEIGSCWTPKYVSISWANSLPSFRCTGLISSQKSEGQINADMGFRCRVEIRLPYHADAKLRICCKSRPRNVGVSNILTLQLNAGHKCSWINTLEARDKAVHGNGTKRRTHRKAAIP